MARSVTTATVGAIDDTSALRPPPMQPMSTPYQQVKEQDVKSPAFECGFHRDQKARWWMIEALLGGTESMRQAGERYLPRFEKETHQSWLHRLQRATLLNYFRKTLMGYVGKPFGHALKIPENYPEHLRNFCKDVDGAGTPLDLFAMNAFAGGLAKGLAHVMVDYPQAKDGDTAEDDAKRRPYAVVIAPENLIGARSETINGVETLTQIRIMQIEVIPDGDFGELLQASIRVLYPDRWEQWKKMPRKKDQWEKVAEGPNSLGQIPVVTFYADKEGFMRSRPPLLDLAHVNVSHWQSSADQRNILSVARFPILVASGVNPTGSPKNQEVGPNTLWTFRDKDAKLQFVEHSGAAITAGRTDLEDLKAEMAILGLQLLMPANSGNPTATAKALDGAEAISELQAMVMNFEIFINQIMQLVDRWYGASHEDTLNLDKIKVDEDYVISLNLTDSISSLLAARSGGDISRKALLDAMKRRGILPETFDYNEDAEQRAEEQSKQGDGLPGKVDAKTGLLDDVEPADDETVPIVNKPGAKQSVQGRFGQSSAKKQIPTSPDRPTPA